MQVGVQQGLLSEFGSLFQWETLCKSWSWLICSGSTEESFCVHVSDVYCRQTGELWMHVSELHLAFLSRNFL